MRFRIGVVLLIFFLPSASLAQGPTDPSVVDYIYASGQRIQLTEVRDAPFYRIRGESNLSNIPVVRAAMEDSLGIVSVHNGMEEFAVRKTAAAATAARAAVARLTRTNEADQLRTFTMGGGGTLLIEYPEVILQCAETTSLAEVQQYLRQHYQVTAEPTGLRPGQFLVRLLTPSHALWLANQLESTTAIPVRYAEVNFWLAQPAASNPPRFPLSWPPISSPGLPNDSGFVDQWALDNQGAKPGALRGADIAFATAYRIAPLSASGIKVAVLDYAIDMNHPEFEGVIDSVFNATRYDNIKGMNDPALRQLDYREEPESDADHGTACAGIIAALSSNKTGISGIAVGTKIIAIQIATPDAEDIKVVNGLTMVAALQAARFAGAQIVSLSWGLRLNSSAALRSVRAEIDAMNAARDNLGILIVSAAGNDYAELAADRILDPDFPADYSISAPNVISVGASNWCGRAQTIGTCDAERWTSRFDSRTLFAPGVEILTTTNHRNSGIPNALNNYRANFNGTSAATPLVAAGAALVMKQHPDWTAAQIREQLVSTAGKLSNGGQSVMNICAALYGKEQCSIPGVPH